MQKMSTSSNKSTDNLRKNMAAAALDSSTIKDRTEIIDMNVNIVNLDGPNDIRNPLNWTGHKKWTHIAIVSMLGFITNFAPTIFAPGLQELKLEFDVSSYTTSTLAITLYVLGIAVGPMVMSPLSEVYGRLPVYHVSMIAFVAFVVGNALSKNIGQFMVFRFLSGCMGGTPLALGGGTIADVTTPQTRGLAGALFSMGPMTGPVIGPVIGGFVVGAKGWRWTFWVLAIVAGAAQITSFIFMCETHPKIICEREAARVCKSTGNVKLLSKPATSITPGLVLIQALVRPMVLLFRSPILLVMSLYVALTFGLMYLLMSTFDIVFEDQYGFGMSVSGLVYLGLGISATFGIILFLAVNKRISAACMKSDGSTSMRPEHRLVMMIWFSPCVPTGLFIYGWTAYYKVHWIVPILGTSLVGIGAFFIVMLTQLYVVDLFGTEAAASALGANILLRYLGGTFLPLAGPSIYKALNIGWANTTLGFLALAFMPAPILFYKFGERLRTPALPRV